MINPTPQTTGRVTGVNGNLVTVAVSGPVRQNETAYVALGTGRLKSEVIRIRGDVADLQVFEDTRGLRVGDHVSFTGELLSVTLGPGLLGRLYDGLQNPLNVLADRYGVFIERGVEAEALDENKTWDFTPTVKKGGSICAGGTLGTVQEGIFDHRIMVPFYLSGRLEVKEIVSPGAYTVSDRIALLHNEKGDEIPVGMSFRWPIKRAVTAYRQRLAPSVPLITKIRLIDSLFPVGKGGTYCVPGPFGAGKTVLQQITSRNAQVDIVIIAACGERAGEVVETIREFPSIIDPLTGRSLMERTIIVCNTSSMPVAARESSVYTAVAMAEYYRQMGRDVLLLADSTSRWAQAMRERSGRLEEIPGEEAFPAYLETVIAGFYERAGLVQLADGSTGSVTIGGTVSPAGGNFDEPVTQATLKVAGAFHALSRERSDARRYPAIDPLESWSTYEGIIEGRRRKAMVGLLRKASEVAQMIKVIGEEGTSLEDYLIYLKGEFFDRVYLQQNAYNEVDAATSLKRQQEVFALMEEIAANRPSVDTREEARSFFHTLRQLVLDFNVEPWGSEGYTMKRKDIGDYLLDTTQKRTGCDGNKDEKGL